MIKLPHISRKTVFKLVGAVALIALGVGIARSGWLDSGGISGVLAELGCWAAPAFLLAFVVGGVVQVPGLVFVVAARLAFGPTWGFIAAYVGAILAATAGFLLVRAIRGRDERPAKLPSAWAQRMLERVKSRPVATVALLRLVFFMSPPLNMGLGFSSIRTHHYLVGTAIGLAIPTAIATCAVGLL